MIRSGTTCYNDMYFAIGDAAAASSAIGIRSIQGCGVFGFPTSWAPSSADCITKNREFISANKDQTDLIHYAICPHAPYTVPEQYMIESKNLARELGVLMHTHIQETQAAARVGLHHGWIHSQSAHAVYHVRHRPHRHQDVGGHRCDVPPVLFGP